MNTPYPDALLNDTVEFWFPRAVDEQYGGFLHCFDRDGALLDTDKSVWAQGRMSWMLLTLYNSVEKRTPWLEWAKSGLDFIDRHCFDEDGRMFFHVTREGRPIRKRRYAFSESFAAIAYAAYAGAARSEDAGRKALELFKQFTDWHFTPGKISPKFTDTRPMISIGPRMIGLVTAQELRENLGENPLLTMWIDRFLEEIKRWFVKPDIGCVMETVGEDGRILNHFDGRLLNPGHAIESSWFIMQEGMTRDDKELVRLGCSMLDWMWERGWDQEYGGVFYFRDVYHQPVQEYWHDMKFWWPHNEAIIATLMAHRLTGDQKYARMHRMVSEWSRDHFRDKIHGEWFGYLHRDGSLSTPMKGNMWKSFFHLPRMQWKCWTLLKK